MRGHQRTDVLRARGARLAAIGLCALVLPAATIGGVAGRSEAAPAAPVARALTSASTVPSQGLATMPSVPVDGVLTMVIPPGAAADQRAGGRGYAMPSVISLQVGDRIVVRNDDDAAHMILFGFVAPGETIERTFVTPGSEVYSSGCGLHGAAFLNFTSIFISDPSSRAGTGDV